ncbi:hypothetical protein U1Q18_013431 [Sarracenia purpurea var. burkii]
MAQFLVILLILTDAFLVPSMAAAIETSKRGGAESNEVRRLGKHTAAEVVVKAFAAPPCLSPSEAPLIEDSQAKIGEGQEVQLKMRRRSSDKSVVGGGLILGGLATAFIAVVFCYIRATGRKNAEPIA